MPDRVIASSQFSSPVPWVLLDEFASIGHHRNATTATALMSAGGTVEVSFELVDPPGISHWFIDFSNTKEREFRRKPQILNTDYSSLVLMRMAVFMEDGRRAVDYFVYKAGGSPRKPPSLDLIPGPYPKTFAPKQIGILPACDDDGEEHYAVVFPAPRFEARAGYEMHVFSSKSQAWNTKVAKVALDRETGCHDMVRHASSKVVPAGGSCLAWIDLWRGVLLCNVLEDDPVLRLLQWPVPPPRDVCIEMYSAHSIRDATLNCDSAARFIELTFDDDNGDDDAGRGWSATVWRSEAGSAYWCKCLKADIASILANDSSFSHMLREVWDDEVNKRGLDKVFSASPTLSLSSEDVVYFMTKLKAPEDSEALFLSVNAREERQEAVEGIPYELIYTPCAFSSFDPAMPRDFQLKS